jgi:hypothetical protein
MAPVRSVAGDPVGDGRGVLVAFGDGEHDAISRAKMTRTRARLTSMKP